MSPARIRLPASQLSGEVASGAPSRAMMARQVDSSVQLKQAKAKCDAQHDRAQVSRSPWRRESQDDSDQARPVRGVRVSTDMGVHASLSTSRQISPLCWRRHRKGRRAVSSQPRFRCIGVRSRIRTRISPLLPRRAACAQLHIATTHLTLKCTFGWQSRVTKRTLGGTSGYCFGT